MTGGSRWGLQIKLRETEEYEWRTLLASPFDPFVEEVVDGAGNYLVLRSSSFDGIATAGEIHRLAKPLLATLNAAMSRTVDADPAVAGAVIEFIMDAKPRKHHFIEPESLVLRVRAGIPKIVIRDANGNVIGPLPTPSKAQLWMRAAALEPAIGSALRYLQNKPGWVELYKAYEALRNMPNGGLSNSEIKRFAQTANIGERHHPNGKHQPPKRPMELWEARSFITQWVAAAIEHILSKTP